MVSQTSGLTALVGAQLIDGTGAPPIPDSVVVIQGERIVAAGPAAEVAIPFGAEVSILEARGMTVLPGFVDSHVHLTFSAGPDHPTTVRQVTEESDETLLLRAIGNAQRALCSGVTTVRDCGGRGHIAQAVRDAVQAGLVLGPRILASGMPITTTGGHLYYLGLEADSPEELRKAVRSQVKAKADVIKVCASGGNMTPGTNPLAAQYSADDLSLVVAEAHRLGRRVAAHAIGTAGIRHSASAGVDTIEHCLWLGQTGIEYSAEIAQLMQAKGLYAGLPLPGIYRLLLPQKVATSEEQEVRLADMRSQLFGMRQTIQQGVRFMVSSDAGVRFTRFEDLYLSLKVAVHGLDLSPMEAIVAATGTAAEALGLGDELGSVVAGKRADLLIVEGDPLSNLETLQQVRWVFRDGRVMSQDGLLKLR